MSVASAKHRSVVAVLLWNNLTSRVIGIMIMGGVNFSLRERVRLSVARRAYTLLACIVSERAIGSMTSSPNATVAALRTAVVVNARA